MICRSASDAQIIVSRFPCGAQPLARASAQGYTPLCAAGAGPYGNTGKHRAGPDSDRAIRAQVLKKGKKIPYPAGIQRSRIGVFLTSEEVRGDNDMEDEPLFIASLQGEGRSQI